MRKIGLDLGARHIAYCEVSADGKQVVDRVTVKSLEELRSRLGPDAESATIAFEACREGWFVYDTLSGWGHDPRMLDTTRIRQMGSVSMGARTTRSMQRRSRGLWPKVESRRRMCSPPRGGSCVRSWVFAERSWRHVRSM